MMAVVGLTQANSSLAGEPVSRPAGEIVPRECLVLPAVGSYGRMPVHRDAVEAQIVAGTWKAPTAGDKVTIFDGSTRTWERATIGPDGSLQHGSLRGGYAYVPVSVDGPRVMLLEARGHLMASVNGEPRAGDPYDYGSVHLPVLLHKGTNDLLFHCGRGKLGVKLLPPRAVALFNGDPTFPDLIVGEPVNTYGAIVVINATTRPLSNLEVVVASPAAPAHSTVLPPLPPLSMRKVAIELRGPAPEAEGKREIELRLVSRTGAEQPQLTATRFTLEIVRAAHRHKRTFRSQIDGSVQYYSVLPALDWRQKVRQSAGSTRGQGRLALFLTLHGAAVEATGQAAAYAPKTWGHIVAPTNRRPYGFDWEDWGRLDAIEVLDLAQKELHTDPQRTYLTGHSMGGHGTWNLGVLYPDRFAAIGPSAGWISFGTYTRSGRLNDASPVVDLLQRASLPSQTLTFANNYAHDGVYVLHGDKDDNVPVTEARHIKEELSKFHHDFMYHEEPGMGHWWSNSDEPGAACVDWPPMFDFFARHVIPSNNSVRDIEFITPSPGVSAWSHWVGIEAQVQALKPSSVHIRHDPFKRRFTGSTVNVARLVLDLAHVEPGRPIVVELDGQMLEGIPWPEKKARIWLAREDKKWSVSTEPSRALKGPHRYGPFKEAFGNRVVFVHGTRGTPEENAWALAKARYDAETFWYRGNGSIEVIADTQFDPSAERDRNVILYGNSASNAAWKALLADSPVQVERGRIRIGDREETGPDLACLFLRPRPGSDLAVVGVVTGTGLAGMRLSDQLPYFVSGVAYPDCVVIGPEMLTKGVAGVRAAGFFGPDWSVTSGEFAWRK
jgi:dienelactone hydrolase